MPMVRTETLILDTGPLWELVLYSAVHKLRFKSLESRIVYLKSETDYRRLSDFIACFKNRTTTPHVVSEISSRVIRTEKRGHESIWRLVYEEFAGMGMSEELLTLLKMPQQIVVAIGATDVSLLQLASRFSPKNACVLSIDQALISECNDAGLTAKNIWEVISERTEPRD